MAPEFDLTPSRQKQHEARGSPRAPVRNFSAKRSGPSPLPRATRARPEANSRLASRGRREAAIEVWPDASEAVHRRVATDIHAVTTDDCARQISRLIVPTCWS